MVTNTAPPKMASARTAVGHNCQPSSNNFNDKGIFYEESSLSFSDMNGKVEEDLDNARNTTNQSVWNTATDLGKSKSEQKFSSMEQVGNELYNPAANSKVGTGGLADPIHEKSPSNDGTNDHSPRTCEAPTAQTAASRAQ